jgi:hypothetical protein
VEVDIELRPLQLEELRGHHVWNPPGHNFAHVTEVGTAMTWDESKLMHFA